MARAQRPVDEPAADAIDLPPFLQALADPVRLEIVTRPADGSAQGVDLRTESREGPAAMTTATDTTSMTSLRRTAALWSLAFGAFAIGAVEFVALGLLPEIAAGLLPGLHASSPEAAIARAGWLVSGYALGVVAGTFTVAQFAGRWSRRRVLVALLLLGALSTAASAVLPTFEGVLAARVVSALPHGAYFGVASLVAASLMGPGRRAGGIAFVLSGLTVATLLGVPAFTALGQVIGWRETFGAVAAMFAVAAVAVAVTTPSQPGDPQASLRRELGSLRNPLVWVTFAISAIGFGGLFAVYSYAAPMTTQVTGLSPALVPVGFAAIGAGMVIGNLLGGRFSDRDVRRSLYVGFVGVLVALAVLGLAARTPAGLMIGLFLLGTAAMSLSPTTQTRMLDVLPTSPALAGALNQAAINLGNSLGAFAGGLAIAAGFGYLSPAWAGMLLAAAGLGLARLGFAVEARRSKDRVPAS